MAVAVGSEESAGAAHRGTSSGVALTWSFNNVAGTFAIMAVVVSTGGSPVITQVRYNGVDFTPIGSPLIYGTILLQLFFLKNPATGSNTASVTATGSATFSVLAGMATFTGTESSGWPVASPNSNVRDDTAAATSFTAPLTPANGSYVVGVGAWGSGENATADAGWTESCEIDGGGGTAGDNLILIRRAGTGAAITPGFSWPTADHTGMTAVEILAALPVGTDDRFAPFLGRA